MDHFILAACNCSCCDFLRLDVACEIRKGSDSRLQAFRKYLVGSQNPAALDAVLRFKKTREKTDTDQGKYVRKDAVVAYFNGDTQAADDFINRRKQEESGCSWDRNDPSIPTFLLFEEQQRAIVTKTIAPLGLCDSCFLLMAVLHFECVALLMFVLGRCVLRSGRRCNVGHRVDEGFGYAQCAPDSHGAHGEGGSPAGDGQGEELEAQGEAQAGRESESEGETQSEGLPLLIRNTPPSLPCNCHVCRPDPRTSIHSYQKTLI